MKRPDFTDVFYAKARCHHFAKLGLRLADEGKLKEARKAYAEALKWEKEWMRLEALKSGVPQLRDLVRRTSPKTKRTAKRVKSGRLVGKRSV